MDSEILKLWSVIKDLQCIIIELQDKKIKEVKKEIPKLIVDNMIGVNIPVEEFKLITKDGEYLCKKVI